MTTAPEPNSDLADRGALDASKVLDGQRITEIKLDNGVVLTLTGVSTQVMREAAKHIAQPKVPVNHLQDADRDEENPNDPAYISAMMQWQVDVLEAQLSIALMLGTQVKELPAGICPWEEDGWIEEAEAGFTAVGRTDYVFHREPPKARYLQWLRLVAITTEIDRFLLTRVLISGFALTEGEVQSAAASFRRTLTGEPDPELSAAIEAFVRDQRPAGDAGAGERVRGEIDGDVHAEDVGGVAGTPPDGAGGLDSVPAAPSAD